MTMSNISERQEYLRQQVEQLEQIGHEDHYPPVEFDNPVFSQIVTPMFPLIVLEEACDRVEQARKDLAQALDEEWNYWLTTCSITIDSNDPSIPRVGKSC